MAAFALQDEKKTLGQISWDDFELALWGIVVIPHEVAFISDRGKIRALPLRFDREKPIPDSSQE